MRNISLGELFGVFARRLQPSNGPGSSSANGHSPLPLSIVTQGRNDCYMGNFKWRLATSLNRYAESIVRLGTQREVELLLVDWGSAEPLSQSMALSDSARNLLKVVTVPQGVAARFNRDSPYSVVHAANCGIRRALGRFIMFCDGDTYLPQHSLEAILEGI